MNKKLLVLVFLLVLFPMYIQAADWVLVPPFAFDGKTGKEEFFKAGSFPEDEGPAYLRPAEEYWNDLEMYAPVYFPASAQGKHVKRMSVKVYDNTEEGLVSVHLFKVDFRSGEKYYVFAVGTKKDERPGELILHDNKGTNKRINNKRWAWYLRVWFWPYATQEQRLYSVRIEYE